MQSTPNGAQILLNGEVKGTTPTTLTLRRSKEHQVVFRLEGHDDVTLNLEREFKFGAAVVGNVFSWGLIGLVVDLSNGSAYELQPEQLIAVMDAQGESMSLAEPTEEGGVHVVFFTKEQVEQALAP